MLNKTRLAVAIAATMGLMSTAGHATTGYFSHGYGTIQSSMGGAGVALPQDAMIAAINPAGMAMLDQHGVVGAAAFSPIRYYTVSGTDGFNFPPFSGPRVKSDNTIFLIPNVAYNWKLDDKSAVGVTVYGNGGMNTEYIDSATPFGLGSTPAMRARSATTHRSAPASSLTTPSSRPTASPVSVRSPSTRPP